MSPAENYKSNPYQYFLKDVAFLQRRSKKEEVKAACQTLLDEYENRKSIGTLTEE